VCALLPSHSYFARVLPEKSVLLQAASALYEDGGSLCLVVQTEVASFPLARGDRGAMCYVLCAMCYDFAESGKLAGCWLVGWLAGELASFHT